MLEAVIASHLAKIYRNGIWGARDITFTAKKHKITVLLGPNGAGKTTTVKMLTTILKPTKGKGVVLGYDIVKDSWEVRKRIALCPQDIRIDPNWSPWEAVKGFLMTRGWSIKDAERETRKWLEELELWDIRNRPSIHLSGGQRKRIAVAMVLATNAEVLFLDEPTTGLDVESKYKVWRALRTVVRNGGTILLTTHDMKEAEIIGDKIVLISQGKVTAQGTVEELISRIPYQYKVIAKNVRSNPLVSGEDKVLNLEDRLIVYAKTRNEALSIASQIEAEIISISEVGLEDAYMYLT